MEKQQIWNESMRGREGKLWRKTRKREGSFSHGKREKAMATFHTPECKSLVTQWWTDTGCIVGK